MCTSDLLHITKSCILAVFVHPGTIFVCTFIVYISLQIFIFLAAKVY